MDKPVIAVYRAGYTSYSGLDTWSALPLRHSDFDLLEPFLFLNHHGRQVFPAGNDGLPFGPHPHKGFETVTFILEGDLVHGDSTGFRSNIREGGVQWMTAGSGIIHSETSSEEFIREGGPVEMVQLWVNLPARLKNTPPAYTGLQKESIPELSLGEGRVRLQAVSGTWFGTEAPIQSLSDVHLCTATLEAGSRLEVALPGGRQVLLYITRGSIMANGIEAEGHDLVQMGTEGDRLTIEALSESVLLLGHATPSGEPVVAHGPFVMNTQEEIRQAFVDYSAGRFGTWNG